MRVLVVGATGGSGRAAVAALVRARHEVTALSRHASAMTGPGVRGVDGDATDAATVDALVAGQDAVVVTLGISENPFAVRLRGPRGTVPDVRSRGTAVVVEAMRRHGVRRLVVQTSYGVGTSAERLPLVMRLLFAVVIAPQIADTDRQARLVHASDLDWVEVQPVNLTDDAVTAPALVTDDDRTASMKVARSQVGQVLADVVERDDVVGRVLAVSHDPRARAAV
ncbi:NAD(P)H-binding protein [Cellulomonas sp. JZ18]|uniref:NAD(P)-dependent oxidoreductase n=1 Tax=Cellulomonas sp. JZ18 TaxID=2654191 RepID=UPI0012D4A665|nr:NAD(P)-binding oxidoreductase [Cellulomonas sp. JZ18]QGQ19440.1 NAD(P)H-binding protein [Cellulomonas sp. JZ18]